MASMSVHDRIRFFVDVDCRESSVLYEQLGRRMLEDAPLLAVIPDGTNPVHLFAAINYLGGISSDYDAFRSFLMERIGDVLAVVRATHVQTNEIGRCAVFLPALATIEGPIALVEVGASAGLNLLLDRYAYRYGETTVADSEVVVRCEARGPVPVPRVLPDIVWRRGIDRSPINVHDDDAVRWLEACVFADNTDRIARLRAAIDLARSEPPLVCTGDLLDDLAATVSDAPTGATVVVMHSAVLPYASREKVDAFQELVSDLGVTWLSLEAWFFLGPLRQALPREPSGVEFLLGRNGTEPLAFAHPHGRWVEWF
jgi:hypothetical protein